MLRQGKRGFIGSNVPSFIARLGIDANKLVTHLKDFGRRYGEGVGIVGKIQAYAQLFERQWGKGVRHSKDVYKRVDS